MADKDPELAKERAVQARLDELSQMTVAELIQCVGVVPVRLGDVSSTRLVPLQTMAADMRVTIDLQALVEQIAEWLADKP